MLIAATVNPGHDAFDKDINQVAAKVFAKTQGTYLEIVNHKNDHYHLLVDVNIELTKETMPFSFMHYEKIRNVKAYQKYMHNHDVVDYEIYGEIGYYEKPNNDDMIDYAINYGLEKTVLKYGFIAIRYYNQLKSFLADYEYNRKGVE